MMRNERAQASVEWVSLTALVALLLAGLIAAGLRPPGTALARSIAEQIACAARLGTGCGGPGELTFAYGEELGRLAEDHAPLIAYERGMRSLPVDFRECAEVACAENGEQPPTAFTHVVDCRDRKTACSEDANGSLFLQYWFYYPDSYTAPFGGHEHDWESYQVRIGPGPETSARASAHHGYDWDGSSPQGWINQIGKLPGIGIRLPKSGGWGPELGSLWVSEGSHAGRVVPDDFSRQTPRRKLWLVPLEEIAAGEAAAYDFGEITPPWGKSVWTEPDSEDT